MSYQLIDQQGRAISPDPVSPHELARASAVRQSWGAWLLHGLLWCEPLWLAALMPSLLWPDRFWEPAVQPVVVAALLLFWPLRLVVTRQLAPATPLNRPMFGLLLWSPVAVWVAWDRALAWQAEGLLVLGIALYFALLNWRPTQQRPWLVVLALGGAGLLLTTLGPDLLQRVPTDFFMFSDDVLKSKPIDLFGLGETINPNVLAGGLLLPIPLLTALAIRTGWAQRRWLPPLLLLLVAPMTVTLILVQSRGSYLALLIALAVVVTVRWPWAGLAMAVALLTTVVVTTWDGAVLFLEAFGSDGSLTSFSGRLEVWQGTLAALADYGVVLGLGLGNFPIAVPPFFTTLTTQIPHAHNLLLQIAVDLGIPGVLLYGWLLVQTARVLVGVIRQGGYLADTADDEEEPMGSRRQRAHQRRQRRRQAALRWALAVGLAGAFTALLVHGLVDAVTWGTKLAFLPWLLFALTALLWLPTRSAEPA